MQTHPARYPTDLSDEEWDYIKSLVPAPKSGKGKRGRPALEPSIRVFSLSLASKTRNIEITR